MAYFSNGTEGELYREQWCYRCRHYEDGPDARECPLWSIHLYFSHEQHGNPYLAAVLTELIPMEPRTLTNAVTVNVPGPCAMFLAREGRDG